MIISVFDTVENNVGKGENAGYQHFLLFPQCFDKASVPDTSKGVIVWEWIKGLEVHYQLQVENAAIIMYFLLSLQCFLPFPKQSSIFQSHLYCRL